MLKYRDIMVTFSEIPGEISLCINIANCSIHCDDCHSKYLWKDEGEELTIDTLNALVKQNEGISCLCLMGGDNDPNEVWRLANLFEAQHPALNLAWYSGKQNMPDLSPEIFFRGIPFNYIKLGPYIAEKGPLNKETTNQRMFQIDKTTGKSTDITYKF